MWLQERNIKLPLSPAFSPWIVLSRCKARATTAPSVDFPPVVIGTTCSRGRATQQELELAASDDHLQIHQDLWKLSTLLGYVRVRYIIWVILDGGMAAKLTRTRVHGTLSPLRSHRG